ARGGHQRRVADRHRRDAVDLGARLLRGRPGRRRPRDRALRVARDVSPRRHALPEHHHAHLLPLHVPPPDPPGAPPPVLDEHGSRRDHHAGGLRPDPPGRRLATRPGAPPLPGGLHAVLLVRGDVVDPAAVTPRVLAPRAAARAAHLRPAVLGHGLPARDVHAEHGPSLPGARPPLAARDPARVLLVRSGGVDGDVRRARAAADHAVTGVRSPHQRAFLLAEATRRSAVAISSLSRPTAWLIAVTTDPVDASRGASTMFDSWLSRTSLSPGRLMAQRASSDTRPRSSASKRRMSIGI